MKGVFSHGRFQPGPPRQTVKSIPRASGIGAQRHHNPRETVKTAGHRRRNILLCGRHRAVGFDLNQLYRWKNPHRGRKRRAITLRFDMPQACAARFRPKPSDTTRRYGRAPEDQQVRAANGMPAA
jgi:hypothetical protein